MFRAVIVGEVVARTPDQAQLARIASMADDYMFAYIGNVTARLAAEFGAPEGGWYPRAEDAVLSDPACLEAARKLREEGIARAAWLASSPELSHARAATERTLDEFAFTIESGAREHGISDRLKLADTTIAVRLADEPDLSVTLVLDRSPIEVIHGAVDAEARIWIASVDLTRIWSPDFYLAMAITKGRLRVEGPVRKFLRAVPILRILSESHTESSESSQTEEVG
jgi:hypothetical protein